MIQDEITDVLLRARIPASTKGFLYIHDALEIMDQDPYYFSGKVCALYTKIAKQHGASFSQVERAIRYAFKSALTHGDSKSVEHYLDPVNTQNSMNLRSCSCVGSRRHRRHIRHRKFRATTCQPAARRYTTRSWRR